VGSGRRRIAARSPGVRARYRRAGRRPVHAIRVCRGHALSSSARSSSAHSSSAHSSWAHSSCTDGRCARGSRSGGSRCGHCARLSSPAQHGHASQQRCPPHPGRQLRARTRAHAGSPGQQRAGPGQAGLVTQGLPRDLCAVLHRHRSGSGRRDQFITRRRSELGCRRHTPSKLAGGPAQRSGSRGNQRSECRCESSTYCKRPPPGSSGGWMGPTTN
jgi:hypothetical protein